MQYNLFHSIDIQIAKNINKYSNFFPNHRLNVSNCTQISLPIEPSNEHVNATLKSKIENGDYHIGNLIVPQIFQKIVMHNGEIKMVDVEVCGIRISLTEIRNTMLKEHQQYMRLISDDEYQIMPKTKLIHDLKQFHEFNGEQDKDKLLAHLKSIQRTRHLTMWHDGSTISNHSHLLIMFSVVYDPAVYHTNNEYRLTHKKNVNIQSIVEAPHIYILAR